VKPTTEERQMLVRKTSRTRTLTSEEDGRKKTNPLVARTVERRYTCGRGGQQNKDTSMSEEAAE
jgi:hypothetical protein